MNSNRLSTPEIIHTPAQLTAYIHLTIPRDQIQHVMGPGINEVFAVLATQGIQPAGPWFTHHLKITTETFDFEICVPINSPVVPHGRVLAGHQPALQVARTVYGGPFEGLGQAWGEFGQWVAMQGLKAATDLYEHYLVGPESSTNPADWRTELQRPLLDLQP